MPAYELPLQEQVVKAKTLLVAVKAGTIGGNLSKHLQDANIVSRALTILVSVISAN